MTAHRPAADTSTMPVGPWLLVVGMHRSGTSAVTGALGQLGLAVPAADDRWEPSEDNPDHWESRALGNHDDVLLERLGGTWDRPPEPDIDWASDEDLGIDDLVDPSGPASTAFPNPGPVVWKDPRSCLVLPYWLAHLPKPVAAVFIWRSPLSVARSLQARDRTHLADGVALWERYNRSGLAGLIGVDTFVTRYESIIEDPVGQAGRPRQLARRASRSSPRTPRAGTSTAQSPASPHSSRASRTSDDTALLLDEQRRLMDEMEKLEGPHQPLSSAPAGPESPWTTALLSGSAPALRPFTPARHAPGKGPVAVVRGSRTGRQSRRPQRRSRTSPEQLRRHACAVRGDAGFDQLADHPALPREAVVEGPKGRGAAAADVRPSEEADNGDSAPPALEPTPHPATQPDSP